MNPFICTHVGLFVAISPSGLQPCLAIQICSALAQKISNNQLKNLDANYWEKSIGMIPYQVNSVTSTQNKNSPADSAGGIAYIAKFCVPSEIDSKTSQSVTEAISSYLAKYAGLKKFNCLVVTQLDQKTISLKSTYFGTVPDPDASSQQVMLKGTSSLTRLALTKEEVMIEVKQIFSDFKAPKNAEYFVNIELK